VRILVIGGTLFVGRWLVEEALERGHQVTMFHRGQTNADLFPEAERIHGDRAKDLDKLAGRTWDAVVDTCGFRSDIVRASASKLAKSVGHYTFISSISVYADPYPPHPDESAPVAQLPAGVEDEDDINTYGARKALCEQAAEAAMPGRVLSIRPGLVVGPYDYVDRFGYWVRRIAAGGDVLCPGRPERLIELIDARDMMNWNLDLIERHVTGVFNATGPERPLTSGEMMEACRKASGSEARLTWVDDGFLMEKEVVPFGEMPFWLPEKDFPHAFEVDCRKAFAAGLRFRPLVQTCADVLAWDRSRDVAKEAAPQRRLKFLGQVGMKPDREKALLAEWRERAKARA
jgi:2'-hydroxyisoflavone reductase